MSYDTQGNYFLTENFTDVDPNILESKPVKK